MGTKPVGLAWVHVAVSMMFAVSRASAQTAPAPGDSVPELARQLQGVPSIQRLVTPPVFSFVGAANIVGASVQFAKEDEFGYPTADPIVVEAHETTLLLEGGRS